MGGRRIYKMVEYKDWIEISYKRNGSKYWWKNTALSFLDRTLWNTVVMSLAIQVIRDKLSTGIPVEEKAR